MPTLLRSALQRLLLPACLLVVAPATTRADPTTSPEPRPAVADRLTATATACRATFERRALDLRVEDFAFPVERIALYESQVELRAEVRLRALGIEPRRPSAATACQLRVAVVGDAVDLRVELAFGDPHAPAYTSAESVVSPGVSADVPRPQAATALAVLAALDRQIDRFVASLESPTPVVTAR